VEKVLKKLGPVAMLYIILQPILDLFTSLSLHLLDKDLTIGIVLRFVFLLFMGVYLLITWSLSRIYLSILAVFLIIHFLVNHAIKPVFDPISEIKYMVKLIYFVVTLLFYFVLIRTCGKEKLLNHLVAAITIIGVVMVLSGITGTAFNSYQGGKEGNVGWFYAGNEIGAILAMGFPVVVLAALKKSNWRWISVLFLIYSLFALGTKVGFGAIVIIFITAIIMSIIKKKWLHSLLLAGILAGTFCYFPFSPLAKNMNMHLSLLGLDKKTALESAPVTEEQVENLVYSGREKFLSVQRHYFREAPLSQKIFGMGYGGNYQKSAKLVEMDFYDLFFSFGILGFILYFLPFGLFLLRAILLFLKNLPQSFSISNVMIAVGILLGVGISYTAGHVLTAPGVSIYLALLMSYYREQ